METPTRSCRTTRLMQDRPRAAQQAFGEIMDLAIQLGGTITGEHGVGRLKRPWLRGQIGEDALALTERIKAAFDPRGILNPGVIVQERS